MLRAVIFDMDGVLVDSESRHYPILRDLLAEYGYRSRQFYKNSNKLQK